MTTPLANRLFAPSTSASQENRKLFNCVGKFRVAAIRKTFAITLIDKTDNNGIILTMKIKLSMLLAAVLALSLFSCASAPEPAEEPEQVVETPQPEPTPEPEAVPEPEKTPEPEQPETPVVEKVSVPNVMKKAPFFSADLSVFESSEDARIWLDITAVEMRGFLNEYPTARFEVRGYTAVFENNIDPVVLSLERARVVADGLAERGIPAELLLVIGEGQTRRWSDSDRRENRVVTVSATE